MCVARPSQTVTNATVLVAVLNPAISRACSLCRFIYLTDWLTHLKNYSVREMTKAAFSVHISKSQQLSVSTTACVNRRKLFGQYNNQGQVKFTGDLQVTPLVSVD